MFAQFLPGAEGADFDSGVAPPRKLADLGGGALLEIEEREHEPVGGREMAEEHFYDLTRRGVIGRRGRRLLTHEIFQPRRRITESLNFIVRV